MILSRSCPAGKKAPGQNKEGVAKRKKIDRTLEF
jgi:hypothetical protein